MDDPSAGISLEELQLAARNHGMPLEALRTALTPVGLHYVLTHYDIPVVDPHTWRVSIDGHVLRPMQLTLEELHDMDRITVPVTLECAGNGRALLSPRPVSQPWLFEAVGTAEWTGVPLSTIIERASPGPNAREIAFRGADRGVEGGETQNYERSLPIADAIAPGVILADEMNGRPLPVQHGFPVRLVVPGTYGMASVKWLDRIVVLDEPFSGYQQAHSYRRRQSEDEVGEPMTKISPRALMLPPGIPEFPSRLRHLRPGRVRLSGRAWSGWGRVIRVDVSDDGGRTWNKATVGEPPGQFAWAPWTFDWEAWPGESELCCRATDETGRTQPLEQEWNLGGYGNNEVQRVRVVVRTERD
jgi:DMSO/TMAO reductase YedYZ molybdopterin-dependent catalytic subunit